MTKKKVEHRFLHIRFADIRRFSKELNLIIDRSATIS